MNLIMDIYKDRYNINTFFGDVETSDSKKLNYLNLIKENKKEYINKEFKDIYPNNDWFLTKDEVICSIHLGDFYLNLITYKCAKTKSFGYTFIYNKNLIHPFHIVDHKFKLIDVESMYTNYKCERCNISGRKIKGVKNGLISVEPNYIIYSCDDMIIKNIIE